MSYVPAKYGVEYIFYVGLESVATAGAFQSSATIASGDVKISKDGGALANLTTLPAVTPGSSKMVKVTVSATEMEAQNVTIVFSDASGGEWKDLIVNIQTAARQIDDLAFPSTSGRGIDVTTGGEVGIDWGNIGNPTTAVVLSGTTAGLIDGAITAAKIAPDAIDADALAADAVTEIQSGLATAAALTTVDTVVDAILVDTAEIGTAGAGLTALASAANLATLTGYVDTEVAAIKAQTDLIPAAPAATGDIPSAASIAAAVWAYVVEGAITAVQAYRIMLSVLSGKSAGGSTTSVSFRDMADSKNRVDATVDADGNRTAVTRDGT